MIKKIIGSLILSAVLCCAVRGEVNSPSVVPGLELPSDQSVKYDEGFLNIQAKCKGDVKWLVVAAVKVKYISIPQSKSIIISVPPQGGVISVFAVGLVDGKITEFARTNITITKPNDPNPPPGPNPPPNPSTKLHVTFVVDMNNTTPEMARLLNSQTLRRGITEKGNWFRLYDIKSPVLVQKRLDQVVAKVGKYVMIVQKDDGSILVAQAIPSTEKAIFETIEKVAK